MKIKNLVFDLDGTIINNQGIINPATKAAILLAQKVGIEIILASGRSFLDMKEEGKILGVNYLISHNGSTIYSRYQKKFLWEMTLDNDIALELYQYAKKHQIASLLYKKTTAIPIVNSHYYQYFANFYKTSPNDLNDDNITNIQAICFSVDRNQSARFASKMATLFGRKVAVKRSSPHSIDFNVLGVSKGQALKKLSHIIDLDPAQTAVFGDGGNDVEMAKWAKYSFAMANAVAEFKKVAKVEIGNNDSDAIATVIKEIIKKNHKGE